MTKTAPSSSIRLASDPAAFVWKTGIDGKRVKVLAAEVNAVRVPWYLKDGASVSGQIATDRQRTVVDASGDSGIGLHKPGARFAADRSAFDAAAAAYAQMVADQAVSWKRGPDRYQQDAGAREGDEAIGTDARRRRKTVARDPFGREAATYEETEDATPQSVADAGRIKQQAYDAYVKDAQEAWKNLRSA